MALSVGFIRFVILRGCNPSYGASGFTPVPPTEHVCFSLSFLDTLARQNDDHPLNQQLANGL
jgi:hypothetical protein